MTRSVGEPLEFRAYMIIVVNNLAVEEPKQIFFVGDQDALQMAFRSVLEFVAQISEECKEVVGGIYLLQG